jgi:hypothetical protein
MKKRHILAVALLLGLAAAFGVIAATRTVGIGTTAHTRVSDTAIAAHSKKLSAAERALRRALNDRPPALPTVPAASRSVQTQTPQIVYHRPAPLIVLKHSGSHGEREAEPGQGAEGRDD